MPNYCDYDMNVYGTKENIKEFVNIIKADYDTEKNTCTAKRHMWRIFEADIYNNGLDIDIINVKDIIYKCSIRGYCAWSIISCMLEGPGTYYQSAITDKIDLKRNTSLLNESKLLNLYIEATSTEPGMEFAEHYRIFNGEMLLAEEKDYHEYYFDTQEELDEFNHENNTNYTLDNYCEYLNEIWNDDDYEDENNIMNLFLSLYHSDTFKNMIY